MGLRITPDGKLAVATDDLEVGDTIAERRTRGSERQLLSRRVAGGGWAFERIRCDFCRTTFRRVWVGN